MNDLTQDRLREVLNYDPATGLFSWKKRLSNRAGVGSPRTNLDTYGYVRIRIDNQLYWAARLVWLYVHGKFPTHDIDHINGVRDAIA